MQKAVASEDLHMCVECQSESRVRFLDLEVELCSLARRFLGRKAYVFEGDRIVNTLGELQ